MRTARRHVGWLLVATGMALIVAGGSLACPHIRSRGIAPGPVTASGAAPQRATVITHRAGQPLESSVAKPTSQSPALTPRGSAALAPVRVASEIIGSAADSSEPRDQDHPAGPPTRIVIPAVGLDAPVVPVSWGEAQVAGETHAAWNVPDDYAAGWHRTSALPGQRGNTVLNGHNTSHGEVFRSLYTLERDDQILLYSREISHKYLVSQTMILPEAGQPLEVRLGNAQYVLPTSDERLTLVTCHPYGSLRNRLIVIARPFEGATVVEPPEEP